MSENPSRWPERPPKSEQTDQPDQQHARDETDDRTGARAAETRIREQALWVDLQVKRAMERGDFDNLPGQGKPIEGLGSEHDPDWWVKRLVEREHIALLPPALALRKEDAELDDRLDRINVETEVRREVEDFNARIRKAIYTPPVGPSGPPVITRQHDVDAEVEAWRERRTARIDAQRSALADRKAGEVRRKPWWRRH